MKERTETGTHQVVLRRGGIGLWNRALLGILLAATVGLSGTPYLSQAQTIEVYYGPEDRPGDKLIQVYESAREYIYVAAYGITYRPGVNALIRAQARGVDVRVITDGDRLRDRHQRRALNQLHSAGIPIKVDAHKNLMHLKQVVVDDRVNTSGSMNLTTSGNRYNDERLNIFRDPVTTAQARNKFLAMWNDEQRYRPWKTE